MNEYSPQRAMSEAEVVKAVATNDANHKDLMETPLASHYDYASDFVDGLARGWRGDIDEVHKDIVVGVHEKAKDLDGEELKFFMDVIEDAGVDFDASADDAVKYLDQLMLKKEELPKADLKAAFESHIKEIYQHQEEAIRSWCLESGKFSYREDQLGELIQKFLQIRPLILFSGRQREDLKWLYS